MTTAGDMNRMFIRRVKHFSFCYFFFGAGKEKVEENFIETLNRCRRFNLPTRSNFLLIGGAVLTSTPSNVDGGLWFETTSTAPIIKFNQGGSTYYLYTNQLVSPNLTLASSTVTVNTGASQTVTLTYSGEGTVTLSNPNTTALTATYNSANKTIALSSNVTTGSADVNLGVA